MGRGRKGLLDQSGRKKATGGLRGRRGESEGHFFICAKKRREKNINKGRRS